MDSNVDEEFQEMKKRFKDFKGHLFKEVQSIKGNVFYKIVDEKKTKEELVNMARGTRPFLAQEIWDVLDEYMDFLRNIPGVEGNNYKVVYENFSKADLVKRLLFKRPIVFCGHNDLILMRYEGIELKTNNKCSFEVAKNLDKTTGNAPYLREYISYDENLLSSLIGMSSPTYYFNVGGGDFGSTVGKPYIDEGILCGLVGARNEKPSYMEHRFVYPRNEANHTNCHKSDYFWIKKVYKEAFPEGIIPTADVIKNKPEIYQSIYINGINEIYLEKRLMLSILPYINEAALRGMEHKRNVFCSVPPIGGGCWAGRVNPLTIHRLIVNGILKYFDAEFNNEKLKYLKALVLPPLDVDIYKSFVPKEKIKGIEIIDSKTITITFKEPSSHKITIFNKLRYVAELLPEEFNDCISIAGYAWDGNSYPGNEYWIGGMRSFDPQAIYCSLLGQFQNPEVNVKMADPKRIRVY